MIGFALITVYMTVCFLSIFLLSGDDTVPLLVRRVLLGCQGYSEHRTSREDHTWKYLYEQYLPEYRPVAVGYAWVVYFGFVDFRKYFPLGGV